MANPKVPQEFWSTYIVEALRRSNPHLSACHDESASVLGGSVVYLPQAGAPPAVVKNRSVLPATPVQRADTAVMYGLDVYTTDPTLITWAESHEISYNKQDSVLGDHTAVLLETVGNDMLYNWCRGVKPAVGGGTTVEFLPTGSRIPTTGAAAAVNVHDGQTGTRKAFTYKDLTNAQALFNKQNVPAGDRYAMMESYMLQQLIDSLSGNQMAAFQQTADLKNGILGKLAGFTILERSAVLAFESDGDIVVPGAALAATDNLACLVWHKNSVTKAMGDTVLFQDNGNPVYYGDIASGLVKVGGRCRRADWKGVAAIVQAT